MNSTAFTEGDGHGKLILGNAYVWNKTNVKPFQLPLLLMIDRYGTDIRVSWPLAVCNNSAQPVNYAIGYVTHRPLKIAWNMLLFKTITILTLIDAGDSLRSKKTLSRLGHSAVVERSRVQLLTDWPEIGQGTASAHLCIIAARRVNGLLRRSRN